MKKLEEIQQQIGPSLIEIEQFRKEKLEAIKSGKKFYAIPALLTIFFGALILISEVFGAIFFLILAALVGFMLVYALKIHVHIASYEKEYKERILNAFIKILYPDVHYEAERFITEKKYEKANLFNRHNRFSGEDYFTGKTEGGNTFEFSELSVRYRTGGKNKSTRTIFDGLFFILETDDTVSTEVYVLPDTKEKKFGNASSYLRKNLGLLFKGAKMVYMEEHPEFEQEFIVYSENEAAAYRVLSPTMIDALYQLKYNWNLPMHVSFIDNKIYLGISSEKNYFKPDIHENATENKLLQEYYNELAACFAVIEDLSDIEKLPIDYNPSKNWDDSAYDHLMDNDNSFF